MIHKPEQTLLCQIIEHHYPEFHELMEAHDCMDAGARVTQEQLPQIVHYQNMYYRNLMKILYDTHLLNIDKYLRYPFICGIPDHQRDGCPIFSSIISNTKQASTSLQSITLFESAIKPPWKMMISDSDSFSAMTSSLIEN